MKKLLFLAHRIPFPPNKGDKIRSFHFLKGLADQYEIYLGAFIDDSEDWKYTEKLENYTQESKFFSINPTLSKIKSLQGFLTGEALTVPYYQSQAMQQWVDQIIQENEIDSVFLFSSAVVQFIERHRDIPAMIDFVDVDSDKWKQYAETAKWPMNWVYHRESKTLFDYDSNAASQASMNIFVSEEESKLFKKLQQNNPVELVNSDSISYVNNGVDTEYFQFDAAFENPYPESAPVIVFTGAMDYWANVDAVIWFVEKVFPLIKNQYPEIKFYIVGSKPAKEVLNLANNEHVEVTGRVEDIRPYLQYASLVVAPLLIARGIQNKVLEAMAMGKPIVLTPQAVEGININEQEVFVEEQVDKFADQVKNQLKIHENKMHLELNRQFVIDHFSWDTSITRLSVMLENLSLDKVEVQ